MENHIKYHLGYRAFFILLSKKIKLVLALFGVALLAWYARGWFPEDYSRWGWNTFLVALVASATYFAIILISTFWEHNLYTYTFTKDAFIVAHGWFMHEEIAALYHQIQSVNIRRNAFDRMFGVSQIVISMVGESQGRVQIVLPGVGIKRARMVQEELLGRARKSAAMPYRAEEDEEEEN